MIKKYFIPSRSPYSLIQEDVWNNEWLVFCTCVLLNCTSRKQVEKIFTLFMNELDTPQKFITNDKDTIKNQIKSLGFVNRRYNRLHKLASYLLDNQNWKDVRVLPGVGEYAARSHEIFCQGILGDISPNDGSLVNYWKWAKKNEKN
jgi:endonuclease III